MTTMVDTYFATFRKYLCLTHVQANTFFLVGGGGCIRNNIKIMNFLSQKLDLLVSKFLRVFVQHCTADPILSRHPL